MTTENKTALQIALTHLAALPPEKGLEHRLLMQLIILEEVKPALASLSMMVAASQSADEARKQARHEQQQAEEARANTHQAEMDAIALAERKLGLEERQERLQQDRADRADRAARRANGHS